MASPQRARLRQQERVSEGGATEVSRDGAFLNSQGRDQRDLTIVALLAYAESEGAATNSIVMVDALAASGLRSLRIAREVPQVAKIFANDKSPDAFRCLSKNVEEAKEALADCNVEILTSCEDAATFLSELAARNEVPGRICWVFMSDWSTQLVDFIDLDPFGSPINIAPSALRCLKPGGLLSLAFFDVQVLTGFGHGSTELCFSRYNAHPLNMRCSKEMGIRIALGCVSKFALQVDRKLEPLLCAYVNCCVRIIVKVVQHGHQDDFDGEREKKLEMVWKCTKCNLWELDGVDSSISTVCEICGNEDKELGGPIWCSSLLDRRFLEVCSTTLERLGSGKTVKDADNLSILFRELKLELSNPLANILRMIEQGGYKVSHSHTAVNLAVKTNAPKSFMTALLRSLLSQSDVSIRIKRRRGQTDHQEDHETSRNECQGAAKQPDVVLSEGTGRCNPGHMCDTEIKSGNLKHEPRQFTIAGDDAESKLSEAIRDFKPGDTILLGKGSYSIPKAINKPLRIHGLGPASEVILVLKKLPFMVISVKSNEKYYGETHVELCNLTVRQLHSEHETGAGKDKASSSLSCIELKDGNMRMKDCLFVCCSRYCCTIGGNGLMTVSHCTFSNSNGGGICICGKGSLMMEESKISQTSGSGLEVRGMGRLLCLRCDVASNKKSGLFLRQNAICQLEDCAVSQNGYAAIECIEMATVYIKKCEIVKSQKGGLFVHSNGRAHIEASLISECRFAGVHVKWAGCLYMRDCQVLRGRQCGVLVEDRNSRAEIERCTIEDNKAGGMLVQAQSCAYLGADVHFSSNSSGDKHCTVRVTGGGQTFELRDESSTYWCGKRRIQPLLGQTCSNLIHAPRHPSHSYLVKDFASLHAAKEIGRASLSGRRELKAHVFASNITPSVWGAIKPPTPYSMKRMSFITISHWGNRKIDRSREVCAENPAMAEVSRVLSLQ
eukprot:750024-Hanusia_phi.AAC.2